MGVITLYFAGSGHGFSDKDDSIVEAYKKSTGTAMFFPGPGGKDAQIYKKNFPVGFNVNNAHAPTGDKNFKDTDKRENAGKRGATGKGWNRNVFFAIEAIADYLERRGEHVTLNFAGHSRGSITVIMLLNDFLHEHPSSKFTIASTLKGVKTYKKNDKRDFDKWYLSRLKKIWTKRMSSLEEAEYGIGCLQSIIDAKNRLSINLFLFDPVGGPFQGGSSRKQDFPNHPCIKRARVLRMETGGVFGTLSGNMPTFEGWTFLTGAHPKNLGEFSINERYLIPLPGMHGAGLSTNKGTTACQKYIGTSYMLGLLKKCGTQFENGYTEVYGQTDVLAKLYNKLYKENLFVAPGSLDTVTGKKARQKIHTHHKAGSYAGNAINAHHCFFRNQEFWNKSVNSSKMTVNPLHWTI